MSTTRDGTEGAVVAPKAPFNIFTPATASKYLKFGVYGASGVGKTTLAATGPKPLFINIEGGDAALIGRDVDITTAKTMKEVQAVHNFLRKGKHAYETVVLDSLTDLHRSLLESAASNILPEGTDYHLAKEQIIRVVRAFRDLDMHVVFVMGMKERTDPATRVTHFQPDLSGQLSTQIPGYVDIFGFMTMKPMRGKVGHYERSLIIGPGPRWIGKDRTGTLGIELDQSQLNLMTVIEVVQAARRQEGGDIVDDEMLSVVPDTEDDES